MPHIDILLPQLGKSSGEENRTRLLYASDMKTQTHGLPLHGDVLEAVVARVSTLDLLPASRVSKEWRTAALSTLRRSPRLPPWLVVHFQPSGGRRQLPGAEVATVAFDPLSRTWSLVPGAFRDDAPSAPLSSYVRRSGARLCALSSTSLALATDPFGAAWRYVEAPRYWRTEPAVAVVGPHVVVAGGASHFEDEASTVEVWSDAVGGWQDGEPVPEAFRWTPAYSVAASDRRMYVLDSKEHVMSWFDPAAKQWGPTRRLSLPAPGVYASAIGFGGGRLILAGISGTKDARVAGAVRPESVRLWAVDEETLEVAEVGRMPPEMVKGLVEDGTGGFWGLWSLGFVSEGGYGYVYNATYPKEFFLCEFGHGDRGDCRWERFPPPPAMEDRPLDRRVFGCSVVSIDDLRKVGLR